jgi:hypothetical protein
MKDWSAWRRVVYVCGSPLIPPVVLTRSLGAVRAVRRTQSLPVATYPAMIAATIVSAVGETIGYAGGSAAPGEAAMTEYEVHKLPHTSLSTR